MNGAELMVQALERQGVGTVFGLPGHLEIFFGALQHSDIRLIHMRHEAAVVIAADGYARTRRGIGVACVTAGPGLANAVGGIVTAYEACTPVLIFCGRNPLSLAEAGAIQEMDHTRAVRAFTKWAATVYDPSRLGEYIDKACRVALSGRPGPVLLDIPRDVAQGKVDEAIAAEALKPLIRTAQPRAADGATEHAAELLAAAEHPLIIAGNGAYWGDSAAGLGRLARDHGIPVMGKALGRGLVPEDQEISYAWGLAHPAARAADVVLWAGARMAMNVAFAGPPVFREDARFIQIDVDAGEIGRNRYVEAPVVGDCGPALEAIADSLQRRRNQPHDPSWVRAEIGDRLARLDEIGREETGREETGMVHPIRIARELGARMPENAIFIGDGANSLNWFKAVIEIKTSPGYMDHEPFGSMGVGLPLAIGAAAATQETSAPRPIFVATGDGALGQYLGELATASLHGLPIFLTVANDGSWGASRNITRRLFDGSYGVDINQSRYDLVAEGLECFGTLAATPGEVGPAFDRALVAIKGGRPAVVNVLVDRSASDARGNDPHLQMVPFNGGWPERRSRQFYGKDD